MQNQALRLSEITIVNLRSIRRETFPLSSFTPLIGYNNAGKTNILMGIHWLLAKISLDISYFDDPSLPVEVIGTFTGLSEEIISRLNEERANMLHRFVRNGSFKIRKVQRVPGESPESMRFFVQEAGTLGDRGWHPMPLVFQEAFERLFPEPIRILDFNSSKTNAHLLHEIFKPLEHRLAADFAELQQKFRETLSYDGDNRAKELQNFDRDVNSMLLPLFPNVRLKLEIPPPSLDIFLKSAGLMVIDEEDGFSRNISETGAGSQRAIQMALVRYLAELKKKTRSKYFSNRLLLIDSPELFLHPQAVELVRVALKKLSQEGYQVVFATHSAQMVTSEDVSTSLLIRKSRERGTFMRKRMEDAVRQVVRDAPSQLQTLFSLSNSNELLFADYVLLTEGKTEWRVLPTLFEKITGKSFALIKCALVRQGGVSNTKKSMRVLSSMDIPVRAIVDLDYAFTSAVHDGFLDRNDPDLEICKRIFMKLSRSGRMRLVNGIPVNKRSRMSAAQGFAMMAAIPEAEQPLRSIHLKLRRRGIWVWRFGAIEEHLGLEGKNEKVWSSFIEKIKTKEPEMFIPHYEDLETLCQWILEGVNE